MNYSTVGQSSPSSLVHYHVGNNNYGAHEQG